MCKRKNNLEKIKNNQVEVIFRLDYYARPGSIQAIFEKMPKDMDYLEYKPTEEEMQIIGLDDVARCLQKSITELLYDRCKVLKSRTGREVAIYVHRNFVAVQLLTSSSDENDNVTSIVSNIFQPFLSATDNINIEDVSCRVTFARLNVPRKDIWNVFDHTAFPTLDDADVISGSYQDTCRVNDLYIDLIRNLETNGSHSIDGVVTASAICSEEVLRAGAEKKDLKTFLSDIVSDSIHEITRCFVE